MYSPQADVRDFQMQSSYAQPSAQHYMFYTQQDMPASQCVTALQTNHESSMSRNPEPAQEPLSAYARFKIEEDELFYRTFPQARYAAKQYEMVYDGYQVYEGYPYDVGTSVSLDGSTNASGLTTAPHSNYATSSLPTSGYYQSIQPSALLSTCNSPHSMTTGPQKTFSSHYNDMSIAKALQEPTSCSTVAAPTKTEVRSVPQPPRHEPPPMDSLPPPPSPTSSSSSYDSPLVSSPEYYQQATYYDHQNAVADSPESLPTDYYSLRHPQTVLYNCYPPAGSPTVHPNGWPVVTRAPSPRGMRLSPLPPVRRPLAKKPPLACLFCRGRKIACGPPEPGSSDRSCNQCQRRSIKCEYPLESRRGMRKKKAHVMSMNSARPKVKLGKKAKQMQ